MCFIQEYEMLSAVYINKSFSDSEKICVTFTIPSIGVTVTQQRKNKMIILATTLALLKIFWYQNEENSTSVKRANHLRNLPKFYNSKMS